MAQESMRCESVLQNFAMGRESTEASSEAGSGDGGSLGLPTGMRNFVKWQIFEPTWTLRIAISNCT